MPLTRGFNMKYYLRFKVDTVDVAMVAGEQEAVTAVAAGRLMEPTLKARLGHNEVHLTEASVTDVNGKVMAQMLVTSRRNPMGKTVYIPKWGTWVPVR